MAGRVAYLDSSAFVKLVVEEPGSRPLRGAMRRWPDAASSAVLRVETVRALRRSGHEHLVPAARRLLRRLSLIRIDEALLDRSAERGPVDLRTLDAIHLESALALGPDLGVLFTYGARLADAAGRCGIDVAAPA